MLDPLTALSVAASAIQFVDFGVRILSKSREIYTSQAGVSAENFQVHRVTEIFLAHRENLTKALGVTQASSDEAFKPQGSLVELCDRCFEEADKLTSKLKSLEVTEGQKHRKWKSVRQALKSEWSKHEVVEMRDRLASYKSDLVLYMILSVQENINFTDLRHSEENGRLDRKITQVLDILEIHRYERQKLEYHSQGLAKSQLATEQKIVSEYSKIIQEMESLETNHQATIRWKRTLNIILSSLRFTELEDRYEAIPDAQLNTFSWVFKDHPNNRSTSEWSSLPKWLRDATQENIYWINGKAGSGKSTLMRYIFEHAVMSEYLTTWVGETTLVTAGFFFWNSGVLQQRTQMGLLRTLLYQIFTKHPELLPLAIPELWERAYQQSLWSNHQNCFYTWPLKQLRAAFSNLVQQTKGNFKFALFIDGLDEHGKDFNSLILLIRGLVSEGNVKVLVSSRPLLEFEKAFQGYPNLRLQDLTKQDIKIYIDSRLRVNQQFLDFFRKGTQRTRTLALVQEIIHSANGVFLWVKLVVDSLLEGISYEDQIEDLEARLRALPKTLEGMFDHMLSRVNPIYLVQTSRLFQLIRSAQEFDEARNRNISGRIYTLFLSLAQDNDQKAIYGPPEVFSEQQVLERCSHMQSWLKTRCAGLLESHVLFKTFSEQDKLDTLNMVQDQRHWVVTYIHRSARDYIEQPKVWNNLVQHTADSDFDPRQAWTRAWIKLLKHIPPTYSFLDTYDTTLSQLLLDSKDRAEMPHPKWSPTTVGEVDQLLIAARDLEELAKKIAYWVVDSRLSSVDVRDLEITFKESPRSVMVNYFLQALEMRQQFFNPIPGEPQQITNFENAPKDHPSLSQDAQPNIQSRTDINPLFFDQTTLSIRPFLVPSNYKCSIVLEDDSHCPSVFKNRREAEAHFQEHLWETPKDVIILDSIKKGDNVVVEIEEFPSGFFVGGLQL